MVAETSELRSGITSAFNKRLNEALQFNPQMGFNIENTVTPSQIIAVLKGEQGTPGLPAAISAVKDDNNLIMLAVAPIERGELKLIQTNLTFGGIGSKRVETVVPKGKKWIIKAMQSGGSGTATVSYRNISVYLNSSITIKILNDTATSLTTVYPETLILNSQQLVIPEGWTIRTNYNVTADTDGAMSQTILYQEITI